MKEALSLIFIWMSVLQISIYASNSITQPLYDPVALYLTWSRDPTTTMTIQWISKKSDPEDTLYYHLSADKEWIQAVGTHEGLPQGSPYLLHRVELSGLKPDSEYQFHIGAQGISYKFRTLPSRLNSSLFFIVGGDIYHDKIEAVKQVNIQAAKRNPSFALLGGDLAYATRRHLNLVENGERWITWLVQWKETMVTPSGCLIPMIATLGNHDVEGKFNQTPAQAPYFYALFAPSGTTSYRMFDVGDYLSVSLLDSGHTQPVAGKQTTWLESALKTRIHVLHKFAIYHVPAYPSVRKMSMQESIEIRRNWVPLFEKYGVQVAFEHHDHDYKRTYRLKGNRKEPQGVLYLGDGAWGVDRPRKAKSGAKGWYLEKTAEKRHFILVTLDGSRKTFEAIDDQGITFDKYVME